MFTVTARCRTFARPFSCSVHRESMPFSSRFGRNTLIDIHPEVQEAICSKQPVVALETAIVTHGMPFPTNLETARSLEKIVRTTGCVPATIGIIGGRVKIGLEPPELERLADTDRSPFVVKISRRDIAPALSMKRDGGTTCSATLIFAALVGIKVFATGGLGGVHRGGQHSMDVSADLQDLMRCPVGLVSAGIKSILDIGRTLEYLASYLIPVVVYLTKPSSQETLGVPVVSYGRNDEFPAFFTPRSGFKAPWNVNDPQAAAQILFTQWRLGMMNGALFGVPIPPEHECVGKTIQNAVEQAITESEVSGISKRGKAVTPWLLRRVEELTEGISLASNIALIQNTSLIGGQIAAEYAKLEAMTTKELDHHLYPTKGYASHGEAEIATEMRQINYSSPPAQLIVVGSAAVDISAQCDPNTDTLNSLGSTSPGTVAISSGGVGRNIAETAHRLLASRGLPFATLLLSSLGDDPFGRLLVEEMQLLGMRIDGLIRSTKKTAVCNMVLDNTGNLLGGVADMDIIKSLDGDTILQHIQKHKPNMIALDGNLSPESLKSIVTYCNERCINVFFEPTSVVKSTAIFPAVAAALDTERPHRAPIAFSSPNILELAQMYQAARSDDLDLTTHASWWGVMNEFSLGSEFRMNLEQLARRNADDEDSSKGTLSFLVDKGVAQMAVNLLPFFQHLVIKCGERGIVVAMHISGRDSEWAHESTNPSCRCVVATGITSKEVIALKHFPALTVDTVVNVTGSGDTLVGSLLASLVQNPAIFRRPKTLISVINTSQQAAVSTLQSSQAVSPLLSTAQM